ncbi:hypothetical protein HYV74_01975 [Candidatus Uhrbacteria bacterium]|nr:hypothetical protein [Candidatus Uhrbacteria bacterium]
MVSTDGWFRGFTEADFQGLPLVIRGESKEVRYLGNGQVVIKFLPSIYSFTENRCAQVPGSEVPRLWASSIFVDVLRAVGIRHAYREVTDQWVLADLVMPHAAEFRKYGLPAFVPPDLDTAAIAALPKAPPIEIIVKQFLTGTTKHGCIGLADTRVRESHPFYAGMPITAEGAFPEMVVRFDWRNPLRDQKRGEQVTVQIVDALEGANATEKRINAVRDRAYWQQLLPWASRVADQMLPDQIADWFIDVAKARRTAFLAAKTIAEFLATKDIVFYDLCMFIAEDGGLVYGELSPDCGRFRHLDLGMLDKDVWRSGGSSDDVVRKWNLLASLMSGGVR